MKKPDRNEERHNISKKLIMITMGIFTAVFIIIANVRPFEGMTQAETVRKNTQLESSRTKEKLNKIPVLGPTIEYAEELLYGEK